MSTDVTFYKTSQILKVSLKFVFAFIGMITISSFLNINTAKARQILEPDAHFSITRDEIKSLHEKGLNTCGHNDVLTNTNKSRLDTALKLTRHVNDLAKLLTLEEAQYLDQYLYEFEKKTGSQLAVFTVPTLNGEEMFSYAQRLACQYKLGRYKIGDGVFLAVAKEERKFFLYIMNDVSPFISDEKAGEIVKNSLIPNFKEEKFYDGIRQVMTEVMFLISGRFPAPEE